jgi:hypothetical protein
MKFKDPHLEREFKHALDDEVRHAVEALDTWSTENRIPEPVITQVLRSAEEQEDIYSRYAMALIAKWHTRRLADPKEKTLASQLADFSLPEIRHWARSRFSWHMVGCAVDLRSRHYTAGQLVQVMEFLAKRCGDGWELKAHDITAPHVHVGRKVAEKRSAVQ